VVPFLDAAMESNMAEAKQRHGCLTTWLILMIIGNALTALAYLLASSTIKSNLPNAPAWTVPTLTVASLANVVFSVALFQWKKWGFFGFVGTSVLVFVINLKIRQSIGGVLLGVLGVGMLYAVLQIGNEKKGWTQLE
jgi:mannose/fructose/N-acetylgalactosamine-specific phosphotransferase system component IIC